MVRLILRRVSINRNNLQEVSLCKWLTCLPEMYPVIICIFAGAEIPRMSVVEAGGCLIGIPQLLQSQQPRPPTPSAAMNNY